MTFTPIAVEEITPAEANELLARNDHNRNLRPARVTALAQALERGEWEINGETIKIADDGRLIDGQHRLAAVSQSGIPIRTLVIRGLTFEAQDTIDTGRKRRLSDFLKMEGYSDPLALAATLGTMFRYRNGKRLTHEQRSAPSIKQALDLYEEVPGIDHSLRVARRVLKNVGGSVGVLATAHYLFKAVDVEETERFFEQLNSGAELSSGDPVLLVRNRMVRVLGIRSERMSPEELMILLVKAFNARRQGRTNIHFKVAAGDRVPPIE